MIVHRNRITDLLKPYQKEINKLYGGIMEKRCCSNCIKFRKNYKGYCCVGSDDLEMTSFGSKVFYCDEYIAKKQIKEVKLWAYMVYDDKCGGLEFYDSDSVFTSGLPRGFSCFRVPSEDKIIKMEV